MREIAAVSLLSSLVLALSLSFFVSPYYSLIFVVMLVTSVSFEPKMR